jgi:hypothetical protein
MLIKPRFEHVKGHQDDHTTYDNLSLEAQMNVDANVEAESYQSMFLAHRPIIPCLPSNRLQLHIANKVISLKLQQSIREAYMVPPYLVYLQSQNKWSAACIATIDWQPSTEPSRWKIPFQKNTNYKAK